MQCNPPSLIELQSLEVQLTTTLQYSLLERTMGMLFRLLKVIRVFFLNNSIYLLNPYNTLNVVQAHYKNKSEQNEVLFSALRDKWGYLIFFRKKICFIIIKGVFFHYFLLDMILLILPLTQPNHRVTSFVTLFAYAYHYILKIHGLTFKHIS